jgi:tRNA threonylcarbamoyl adenosine modification protein YeaZ
MFVLALDTATAATSVAVVSFDGGQPVVRAARRHVDARAHGEQIAPQIADALAETGVGPAELAAIVAGTGPGPFTGLRVGLATAVAMGQALDVPTYGVCSLDGIGLGTAGLALVATDARRREVYWAIYQDGRPVTEPAVDRPADVLPVLADRGVRQAYGEGALRYRSVIGLPVAEAPLYPDPAALVVVAYDRIVAGKPAEPLAPLYLRRPDAAEPRAPKRVTPR